MTIIKGYFVTMKGQNAQNIQFNSSNSLNHLPFIPEEFYCFME